MTPDLLRAATGCSAALADRYAVPLADACQRYSINTPARLAAFLAQIGHESGGLQFTREIAGGQAYEGRIDLGNTEPGDGPRFRGRGLLQVTGRSNYAALSDALGVDFVADPSLLEQSTFAALTPVVAVKVSTLLFAAVLALVDRLKACDTAPCSCTVPPLLRMR